MSGISTAAGVLESLRHLRERFGNQAPLLAYGGPAKAGPPSVGTPGYVHLADDVRAAAQVPAVVEHT